LLGNDLYAGLGRGREWTEGVTATASDPWVELEIEEIFARGISEEKEDIVETSFASLAAVDKAAEWIDESRHPVNSDRRRQSQVDTCLSIASEMVNYG
jgi:hypothetical protein